jgi:lysophospholipase L1-like esterase
MGPKCVWRWLASTALLACLVSPAAAQTAQAPAPPVPDCPDVARAIRDMVANDTRLRDWPNLTRYRQADADLARSGDAVPVVFLGDSITDRWDDEGSGGFFPGRHYVNRGIGGQTTPQMLIRLRPDVLSHHPKVMVLLAGTNDIAGNTGPMSDEDGVKVVLAGILPISDYHQKPDQVPQVIRRPMSRIAAINAWIKQYAAAHGHVFLDYAPGISDARGMLKAEFSEDDLHPNALGYAQMAPLAEAAIAKAMH